MTFTPAQDAAPPQSPGYYDRSTGEWCDLGLGRCLPAGPAVERLDMSVEEVSDLAVRRHGVPIVGRLLKAPRYRFVGVVTSADPRWPTYRVVGETFSTSRPKRLGGDIDAKPWATGPAAQLNEFVAFLFERGWQPESHGVHWWSLTLIRPCVHWPDDVASDPAHETLALAG